jgi:hypothetical protein
MGKARAFWLKKNEIGKQGHKKKSNNHCKDRVTARGRLRQGGLKPTLKEKDPPNNS